MWKPKWLQWQQLCPGTCLQQVTVRTARRDFLGNLLLPPRTVKLFHFVSSRRQPLKRERGKKKKKKRASTTKILVLPFLQTDSSYLSCSSFPRIPPHLFISYTFCFRNIFHAPRMLLPCLQPDLGWVSLTTNQHSQTLLVSHLDLLLCSLRSWFWPTYRSPLMEVNHWKANRNQPTWYKDYLIFLHDAIYNFLLASLRHW